jgi:hypothetical protein
MIRAISPAKPEAEKGLWFLIVVGAIMVSSFLAAAFLIPR